MEKTYYKVCFKEDNDNYLSLLDCGRYSLAYALNQKTIPKVGKLFAFKDLDLAINFYINLHQVFPCVLLEGQGQGSKFRRKVLPTPLKTNRISIYWSKPKKITGKDHPPKNTYALDWFTPRKVILNRLNLNRSSTLPGDWLLAPCPKCKSKDQVLTLHRGIKFDHYSSPFSFTFKFDHPYSYQIKCDTCNNETKRVDSLLEVLEIWGKEIA